jgi:hypothetical protein
MLLMSSENLVQSIKRVLLIPPNNRISRSSICILKPLLHSRIVDWQGKDFGMVPEIYRL